MRRLLSAACLALCSLTAQAEEHTLEHKGLTLSADLTLAEDSSLADGVVLMTHGTLAHGRMEIMATLQELLAERGINSLSITLALGQNLRRGMYDCESLHNHKHSDAAVEIGLWYDWLKAQGAGDIDVLGHSRGGAQTAEFALNPGERQPRSAILVAPAVWTADKDAAGYQKNYGKDLAPVLKQARDLVAAGKGDQVMENTDFVYCAGAKVTAASFADWYQGGELFDAPTSVANSKLPTLVVAGSADTTIPTLPARMKPVADGERVKFEVIEDADHFFLDLYAEELADLIEEFRGAL